MEQHQVVSLGGSSFRSYIFRDSAAFSAVVTSLVRNFFKKQDTFDMDIDLIRGVHFFSLSSPA